MLYLTISKKEIEQSPNKTIAFDAEIISFVKPKPKYFGGRECEYYEYVIKPINLIIDGSDWSGIQCSFDFTKELHDIVGKDSKKVHIEVRQLKSNGKYFNTWAKSHVIGKSDIASITAHPTIEEKSITKQEDTAIGDVNMTKALDNWNKIIEANPPATTNEKRVDTAVIGSLNAFYNANPSIYEGTNIKCPLKDKYKLSKSLSIYLSTYEVNSIRYKFLKKLIDAVEMPDKDIIKGCKKEETVADANGIDFDDNDRREAEGK